MCAVRAETDQIIDFLNSIVDVDEYAIAELLCIRVPCNDQLADHPTVQVGSSGRSTFIRPGTWRVGILGIINGYCGVDEHGNGPIAAIYEDGHFIGFRRYEAENRSSE